MTPKMSAIIERVEHESTHGSFANHTAKIAINRMYLDTKTADFFFVFDEQDFCWKVPAHKCVLAVISPVFNTMFYGSMIEKNEVQIVDASAKAFKQFLQFFYSSEVTLTMEEIGDVMNLGKKYEVPNCVDTCSTFLIQRLTMDTVCFGYGLGVLFEQRDLIKFCEQRIQRDPQTIFSSSTFLECDRILLRRILHMNIPSCSDTQKIEACIAWAKAACERKNVDSTEPKNQRYELGDLFTEMPFQWLRPDEFFALVPQCVDLFSAEGLKELLRNIALHEQLHKIKRKVRPIFR